MVMLKMASLETSLKMANDDDESGLLVDSDRKMNNTADTFVDLAS